MDYEIKYYQMAVKNPEPRLYSRLCEDEPELVMLTIKWIPSIWDRLFFIYPISQKGVYQYIKDYHTGEWCSYNNPLDFVPETEFFQDIENRINHKL